jgi:glycosyltransferase involved in cell wall biosynthesis
VARYGIDTAAYSVLPSRASARAHFGLSAPLVVGALGRMTPIKNQRVLVDAVAQLVREGVPVQLLLVGDGECRTALERQVAALGLEDSVRFHHWQPDLRVVYAALDLLVIPSKNEGMPIAALEAMASGVGVVASAVGGLVDLVQDRVTGWLVPPDDVAALSLAIDGALRDTATRARIAQDARAFVRQHHDLKATCERVAALYDELVPVAARYGHGRPAAAGSAAIRG